MKASDILLTLENRPLEVWCREGSIIENRPYSVCVRYAKAKLKDKEGINECFGAGKNFEDACDEYLSWIRGKTLVFVADDGIDEEVRVLG